MQTSTWNCSCKDTVLDFLALACSLNSVASSLNRESSAELALSLCVRELYLSESPQSVTRHYRWRGSDSSVFTSFARPLLVFQLPRHGRLVLLQRKPILNSSCEVVFTCVARGRPSRLRRLCFQLCSHHDTDCQYCPTYSCFIDLLW